MSTQRIFGGQTKPGATDWQQFGDPGAGDSGIFVDVDTSSGNFSTTPIYLASLGGSNNHWTVTGTSSIYNATPYGFSIYLRWSDHSSMTPNDPTSGNQQRWHINWLGIETGSERE